MTSVFTRSNAQKYLASGLSLTSAIGIIALSTSPSHANTVCRVGQVLNVQVLQGQPQWASSAAARVAGAIWQFNDNGTFIYAPADARTDLYPMQGSYQRQGSIIQFQGSSFSSSSVSRAGVELQGQIDTSQNPPVLMMSWASSNNLAAVVNNTVFSQRNAAVHQATVSLTC